MYRPVGSQTYGYLPSGRALSCTVRVITPIASRNSDFLVASRKSNKFTTPAYELRNFFTRVKVCCVLSNVGGSEKSQLWVVVGGSEKNRLRCVAAGMSNKQCHSKCSEWPPSALIHASSLFRHWSVAQYTTPCWNSAHVATSRCRKPQHVRINTRAPPVACPRGSTTAMQITESTKQQ